MFLFASVHKIETVTILHLIPIDWSRGKISIISYDL